MRAALSRFSPFALWSVIALAFTAVHWTPRFAVKPESAQPPANSPSTVSPASAAAER